MPLYRHLSWHSTFIMTPYLFLGVIISLTLLRSRALFFINFWPVTHFWLDTYTLNTYPLNSDREERVAAVTRLNDCITDVRTWLTRNMFNLNDEKTEVILFTSKHGLKSLSNITITVGEQKQLQSSSIRDLGLIYDQHLNMSQHVHSVCRTGYYHLSNIGRIRWYLTLDATKTPVHALVTSRLDYCNSLLYGLPTNHLAKMPRLQNACVRVITRTGRRSHITPVLKELHWRPAHRRIQYKVLLHTYCAIHHRLPIYLSDLLSVYRPTRSLRSE